MHHAYLELERFDNVDDPHFYHYDDADPVDILQKSYEQSMLEVEKEVSKALVLIDERLAKQNCRNTGNCWLVYSLFGDFTP